jgi:hypothetical protein
MYDVWKPGGGMIDRAAATTVNIIAVAAARRKTLSIRAFLF